MSDIQRIFNEDPHNLTRADYDALIEHYRAARAAFNLGAKQAGAKAPKAPKAGAVEVEIDLLSLTPKAKP